MLLVPNDNSVATADVLISVGLWKQHFCRVIIEFLENTFTIYSG